MHEIQSQICVKIACFPKYNPAYDSVKMCVLLNSVPPKDSTTKMIVL